jgi:uncharacterized membrane protein
MIRSPIYSTAWTAAWRAAVVLLSVYIAYHSVLRYLLGVEEPAPPIVANAFANPFLAIHVVGGVTALLVGPFQFVRLIRTRWPAFHRATGRIYIIACAIGAPSGFMLALGSTAGPVAGSGFALLAVLSGAFTWLGYRAAVERRFGDHREWMLRSYALTSAAITLRLMLPTAVFVLDQEFDAAYRVIAWLSWTTNLALVEYHIRRSRGSSATYARFARA